MYVNGGLLRLLNLNNNFLRFWIFFSYILLFGIGFVRLSECMFFFCLRIFEVVLIVRMSLLFFILIKLFEF